MFKQVVLMLFLFGMASSVRAQLGSFSRASDIGAVGFAGSSAYNPVDQSYLLTGSGTNMWGGQDEFHFLHVQLSGDFILRARVNLVGEGVDPHRKAGWMIRESLAGNARYADAALHGDGLTALQYRSETGGETQEIQSAVDAPDVLQLAREGDQIIMSVARFGEPLQREVLHGLSLPDTVFVGLFVCAHNNEVEESARFQNVRIIEPAPSDFRPYQDYIGSRLEVMEVETGLRRVLHTDPGSIQAPNWTPDGKALIYNHDGRLFRFDLADAQARVIESGFAIRNNNDHVISPDGTEIAISHHAEEADGESLIYRMPIGGGQPRRVTERGPSYLHGWSPDGGILIYTAQRNDQYDIYAIPSGGGPERPLTNHPRLDDGPEYSPDGSLIYFNSARSGSMQLWQMNPDGSEPKRLTEGPWHDWFPHASPDGSRLVFLSFGPDVDAEDHPFYRHVLIRDMPSSGGEPRVLAYVYGGQGTINVPSWSPDGLYVAFVSNSGRP